MQPLTQTPRWRQTFATVAQQQLATWAGRTELAANYITAGAEPPRPEQRLFRLETGKNSCRLCYRGMNLKRLTTKG
ncbi:hypothetical protein DENIT_10926 [Pseudomonas veronii]|nr:hypothetical protein DENIT_10926 [Pseudomonas veronii]